MSNETENYAKELGEAAENYKYGKKLDGTPKNKPGRKATGQVNKTKTIFVYRGRVVGRGKPSLEQVKHRTQVILPANAVYSESIHGVGTRLAEDDARVTEWETEIANREFARKAAKTRPAPEVNATAPNNNTENAAQPVETVAVATENSAETPGIVEL